MRTTNLATILLAVFLGACGGGGGGGGGSDGGGSTPPTTVVSPTVLSATLTPTNVKLFRFAWNDVADETEYRLLEDADGVSGFTQVATIAADATTHDHEVFLPARVNARYIVQACNATGCTDSATLTVSGTLREAVGYVKASNTNELDEFGFSVALSGDGNTLAVGAKSEQSNATGINGNQLDNSVVSGAVYVFVRNGTLWTQQAYVKASNTGTGDQFGTAVALAADGNTLAVGAPLEDSSARGINIPNQADDPSTSASGAVYIFVRNGTTWSQQAYVKASNTGAGDQFGTAVAVAADGNTLAVGAVGEESSGTGVNNPNQADNSANDSGAVYIFTRSGALWTQQAYVKASNTAESDRFGTSVALAADGNTLAIGAVGEDSITRSNEADNSAPDSGAVYVFVRSGALWTQQAYLKSPDAETSDLFGSAVALNRDGNTLAIGVRNEDSSATGIDGDHTDNSVPNSGAVYVFVRNGTTWSQEAYIKAPDTNADDLFGFAVAFTGDGNTLAIGAPGEDGNATGLNGDHTDNSVPGSGAVYLFIRNGTTWSQQAYVKASNTERGDEFGLAVALAADGNTLAVEAFREASSATGINGDQGDNSAPISGAVYLF